MSLRPDDRSSRSRAKSPSGRTRDRSRSRSHVRSSEKDDPKSPIYEERTSKESTASSARYSYPTQPQSTAATYAASTTSSNYVASARDHPYPATTAAAAYPAMPDEKSYSSQYPSTSTYPPPAGNDWTMGDYKDLPPHERPGFIPPAGSFPADNHSANSSRQNSYNRYPGQGDRVVEAPYGSQSSHTPQLPQNAGYSDQTYFNQGAGYNGSRSSSYTQPYSQQAEPRTYSENDRYSTQYPQDSRNQQFPGPPSHKDSYSSYGQTTSTAERRPHDDRRTDSYSSKHGGAPHAPQTLGLAPAMGLLSVGGPQRSGPGDLPPPSPLLEAYRGTYQQMSPMPLALRPHEDDEDLSDLELSSPAAHRTKAKGVGFAHDTKHAKEAKRVKVYDPEDDAKTIAKALNKHKVDTETITDILTGISHDDIVLLKREYKKQVKVQGKGVNLSKHLKTKLTGNVGKAAYVTALGRWESEGYWANFFYQSHNSRRELLIESLMGRTNGEIWQIKDEFKDKRYADDLVKCMEKELKMDKFRTAVLMVLEERRQEEQDEYPVEYKMRDVETLRKALVAEKGGESTMLEIIVRRSDAHLREVLRIYERTYGENFPRAALKKSNNLVGEVIAHILNGVINKPARDALLLRHAIDDVAEKNKDEELRYELLISRLVRLHWDKVHLIRVKREYGVKYKATLEEDLEEAAKGDFVDFMVQLCQTKTK